MTTTEEIIGATAEIVEGRLIGRSGKIVAVSGDYVTLQTRYNRLRVSLNDVDIWGFEGLETLDDPAPAATENQTGEWCDLYAGSY